MTDPREPNMQPEGPVLYRSWVAFWLSLLVHLAVFLTGGLLIRAASLPSRPEPVRSVGIVLAATRQNAASETQYFDEAVDPSATATDAAASPVQAFAADAAPAGASDIALPGQLQMLPDAIVPGMASVAGASRGRPVIDPTAGMEEILAEEARRPRPSGPQGEPGEVKLFGVGTIGHSFVFVIDRSQSMGGDGLDALSAAAAELEAALAKLESNHSFQVVAYNQSHLFMSERKLLEVNDQSRAACKAFLENLSAYGATNHERALIAALQLRPDVLYLLTDGDPVLNPAQRKRIRDEARGHTTISCIHFGRIRPDDDAVQAALETVARENRGTYRFVDMSKR